MTLLSERSSKNSSTLHFNKLPSESTPKRNRKNATQLFLREEEAKE